jgi:predicted RNase H-like HicB family nuclease
VSPSALERWRNSTPPQLIQIKRRRAGADLSSVEEDAVDACYYSIIERAEDGHFYGWVPDLAGVTADGCTEKEVVDRLFREVRDCVRNLILTGAPIPQPRALEELPGVTAEREARRLLLVIT